MAAKRTAGTRRITGSMRKQAARVGAKFTAEGVYKTAADLVADANNWTHAQALGYLDGKRDRERKIPAAVPRTEMSDYAHGYWKGFSGK